ncbi:MAG TPA: hypothetical protein VM532_15985 [Burkholderiales bacterium]|jgi:hypothetical protein|nr:hypothetical protein [Burkholderiales bacterium]
MKDKVLRLLPDALITAGLASVSYGVWSIYEPAGYIVGGALMAVIGYLADRRAS